MAKFSKTTANCELRIEFLNVIRLNRLIRTKGEKVKKSSKRTARDAKLAGKRSKTTYGINPVFQGVSNILFI